jgi:hypothetical protein
MRLGAILVVWSIALSATAQTPGGAGIIYGKNHAFTISAPPGWVLDNNAEQNNGLCAVFYPAGSSWAKSSVVMYVNTALKGEGQQTREELITFDTQKFKAKAPNLSLTELPTIAMHTGSAIVKKFAGDQFNNFEAVAYIDAPNVVAMLVLTSRDEAGFLRAYPAFEKLVGSYRFLTSDVRIAPTRPPK